MPPYDATVVTRLKRAGAVLLGKLNCDEFAMGSSNENSAFGATRNPWDDDARPGRIVGRFGARRSRRARSPAALGTDTGGSIRQPAAFCGVVGLKPTYGRVSRYGVIAFASSLDQVGPFARDVGDAAVVLEAIAGHDPADSTSSPRPVPAYVDALASGVRGLRLGLPKEYFVEGMQPEVAAAVRAAVTELERLGAVVEPVSLPHTEYAVATYYLIATAEASSNLARYDGVRYGLRESGPGGSLGEMYERSRAAGFGAEVKRRIMLGTYALSAGYYDAYYVKAQQVRTLIRRDFEQAFARCDVLVTPIAPDHGLPHRREDRRPAHDVPLRHLHDLGEPGRPARSRRPVRRRRRRAADRPAGDRPALRRGDHAAHRRDVRAGDRLASPQPAAMSRRR